MLFLTALAISTGVVCGIWGWVSAYGSLIGFAGFAGTTSYFAYSEHEGIHKVPKCFVANITGVIYAMLAMYITELAGGSFAVNVFMTGLISFLMVYQNRIIPYLSYIPGAFIGCFTTFATGGDWWTFPSMCLGYLVALGCDYGGQYLFKLVGKKEN